MAGEPEEEREAVDAFRLPMLLVCERRGARNVRGGGIGLESSSRRLYLLTKVARALFAGAAVGQKAAASSGCLSVSSGPQSGMAQS